MSTSTITPARPDAVTREASPVVVGLAGALLALVVSYAVSRYFATGCGAPDAKFACLIEGIVAGVAAPVVVPLAAWPLLRLAGVRHALLTALLAPTAALALAYPAQQLVLWVHAVSGGATVVGNSTSESALQAIGTALAFGVGTGCGVLLLSGRVGWKAWVVTGTGVAVAVGAASVADGIQRDHELRVELADADVPLFAPPEGWVVHSVRASGPDHLAIVAHPREEEVYLERTVNVVVSTRQPESTCGFDLCETTADGLVLATSETSTDVLLQIAGAFVEVTSYDDGPVAEEAVLEVARGLRTLDVDALVDLAD